MMELSPQTVGEELEGCYRGGSVLCGKGSRMDCIEEPSGVRVSALQQVSDQGWASKSKATDSILRVRIQLSSSLGNGSSFFFFFFRRS